MEKVILNTTKGSFVSQVSFLSEHIVAVELLLLPSHAAFVLSMFTLRPEHFANSSSVFRQWCNELSDPSRVKRVSSACWPIRNSVSFILMPLTLGLVLIPSAKSSTHKMNRLGKRGSPCRTPLLTGKKADRFHYKLLHSWYWYKIF